jgi:hypothetical protein
MNGPCGLLLVVPHLFAVPIPICCPNFSFICGVAKECITKLGCEKYFRRVTGSAPLEMLLSPNSEAANLMNYVFFLQIAN